MPSKSQGEDAQSSSFGGVSYERGAPRFTAFPASRSKPAFFLGRHYLTLRVAHKDADASLRGGPSREQSADYSLGILSKNVQEHSWPTSRLPLPNPQLSLTHSWPDLSFHMGKLLLWHLINLTNRGEKQIHSDCPIRHLIKAIISKIQSSR